MTNETAVTVTHRVLLHDNGPALWPEHKPLEEVVTLKETTPKLIWSGTYQGIPTPPGGYTFKRKYWRGKNRYDPDNPPAAVTRFQSWDTASKDTETSAYSVCITGIITADYQIAIERVLRQRLEFPELPPKIEREAARSWDHLKGVIIEDKSSGISAYQTLRASANKALRRILFPFDPKVDKETRASQAALWAANDSVLLPHPGSAVLWLTDFEDELFDYPQSTYKDQIDAFSQLIIYCENYLASGYHKRRGK